MSRTHRILKHWMGLTVAVLGVCLVIGGASIAVWLISSRDEGIPGLRTAIAIALAIIGIGIGLLFAGWWIDRGLPAARSHGFEVHTPNDQETP